MLPPTQSQAQERLRAMMTASNQKAGGAADLGGGIGGQVPGAGGNQAATKPQNRGGPRRGKVRCVHQLAGAQFTRDLERGPPLRYSLPK